MKRLLSKFNRLRSMSNKELSYRLAEVCRIEADRLRYRIGFGFDRAEDFRQLTSSFQGSLKGYLESAAAPRFYSSIVPQQREATVELLNKSMPGLVDRAVKEAERLCGHRVNLLSHSNISIGKDIDWHCDPVSGHRWKERFWADYDLVHDSTADPKMIHELNRQQHLPRLAKAFLLTREERYAREAVAQMETWIDQNSVGQGVNWQSSLELAIRTNSWLWTIFMLLPSNAMGERAVHRIVTSLFQQIEHIYRYPSVYSSPNTHLIGEATALFIAGLLFPEWPRALAWREKGLSILTNELEKQTLADGVYFELSSYYHCYATDFFLQAFVLARVHRIALPEWTWKRLAQMVEFVMHLTRPDGTIPLLGDDDGGRALALASENYNSYRDGLCSGAVLFGRPDFKHASGHLAEETLWLLGASAVPVYASLPAQPSNRLHHFCAEAGYFIQRSDWSPEASHLVFDCGGHGTESGGHAHADALSISLFGSGSELLVDGGTSIYNTAPEWRKYFRSTRAHNTVVVDGLDQSVQGDTFTWESKATTRVLKHLDIAGLQYVDGEHDGYGRLRQPVSHRRRVLYVRPNYWIVLDQLRGNGEHTFDFMYHFAPGTRLFVLGEEERGEIDCRAHLNNSGLQMGIYATAPMHAEALCGQLSPIQGWTSSRYGERKPAPMLKGSIRASGPVASMTFLLPGAGNGLKTRRLKVAGGRALAAVVRDGEFEDICVLSLEPSATLQLMDFSMCGECFWMRTENGTLRQLLAVNASSFSSASETVFREKDPISHVMAHLWENGIVIERGEEEGKVYVRDLRDRQFQRN